MPDDVVPYLRALSDDVHEQGAAVLTQLTHLGHRVPSLLRMAPRSARPNGDGRFELYRVGDAVYRVVDAVTSRNIHAAVLDSVRLCNAI